jgi:hypothetical protein
MADPIRDYRDIRFDADGKPYYMTTSGKRFYIPPSQAAQAAALFIDDPDQRQALLDSRGYSTDTIARLITYAKSNGVTTANPSGDVPKASFSKSRGEWNPATGEYEQHMGRASKARSSADRHWRHRLPRWRCWARWAAA